MNSNFFSKNNDSSKPKIKDSLYYQNKDSFNENKGQKDQLIKKYNKNNSY